MSKIERQITPKSEPDQVTRAVAGVHRAVGKLVTLLGDQDPEVARPAALALAALGARAVLGPLAAILERTKEPGLRAAIVLVMGVFTGEARTPVVRALLRARTRETDPEVLFLIRKGLFSAMMADVVPGKMPGPTPPASDLDAS